MTICLSIHSLEDTVVSRVFGDAEQNNYQYVWVCIGGGWGHSVQLVWKTLSPPAGSYTKTISNFAGSFQTVFQSGCTILHCHQQSVNVPVVLAHHLRMCWVSVWGFYHCGSMWCYLHVLTAIVWCWVLSINIPLEDVFSVLLDTKLWSYCWVL